ncbi:acetolactate decarboxylase [Pendulispora rubella]|uniref:Alpha-acetolactate decarboxylase n=1 Tax=Pendulispora rubella TaxID=2741070 RepID=A0ABZ2L7D2_9BACT
MHRWASRFVFISCIVSAGCAGSPKPAPANHEVTSATQQDARTREDAWKKSTLTQFGTLEQLIRGGYDGPALVGDLAPNGDFGLGTYNALDGEMVVLDGVVYKVPSDGVPRVADRNEHTPFAAVTFFHADQRVPVSSPVANLAALQALITNASPDATRMLALKVHGTFSTLKLRAPRRQSPPYAPLAEATKSQVEFTHANVTGTMVGFRLPQFLGTTNATGYHFHFVSDDHQKGGHVLEASTNAATIDVQTLERLRFTVNN